MRPIKFPGANIDFVKPRSWNDEQDGECLTLPVCVKNGVYTSVWAPSSAERERIANGENVVLQIIGVQAPVMLNVARIEGEHLQFTGLQRLVELAQRVAQNPDEPHASSSLAHAVMKELVA